MTLTQTLDHPKSAIDSSYADSCIAERKTDIAVVLIPPDDFNLNGDALPQNVKAPEAQMQNSPVLLSYALRKNGSSEADVYSTIHTCVLPADRINSNCISGGIAH